MKKASKNSDNTRSSKEPQRVEENSPAVNRKKKREETEKARSRGIKAVILVVVLAVLAVVAGGYASIRMASEDNIGQEEEPTTDEEDFGEIEDPVGPQESENPFSSAFPQDKISIPEDSLSVSVNDDDSAFMFSDIDLALNAENGEAVETSGMECNLPDGTSICYAGYIELEDIDDIEVFAVKNIVENRLLENSTDTDTVEIDGAHSGHTGILAADERAYIAAAGDNGSGFLLFSEDITSIPDNVSFSQE